MSYKVPENQKTQLTKFGMYLTMRGTDRMELSIKSGVSYSFICGLCRKKDGESPIPTSYSTTFFPNLKKLMVALECKLSDIV